MINVKIREAYDKDIIAILGLLYELGRPKPQEDSEVKEFKKMIKTYISNPDKRIFVAEINEDAIVGMVSTMILPRLNQINFEIYIPELVVLKKYQHCGIGKKLIESCVEFGKQKGSHRIRLESGNQRKESHEFYKKLGFEQPSLSFTKNLR